MKRLLVPVDGSPSALRAAAHAADRARRGEAIDVHLLHVQVPLPVASVELGAADAMLDRYQRAEAEAALAPPQRLLADADLRCERALRAGDVPPAIASYAEEHRCDEIVMGMRGRGALGRLVMGSVANHVLHLTKVPVTLVR